MGTGVNMRPSGHGLRHNQRGAVAIIVGLTLAVLIGFAVFLLLLRSMMRGLKGAAPPVDGGRFEAIRLAALVSLWSLLFRGLTNAKPHEFGFYALAMIAGTVAALRPQAQEDAEEEQRDWEEGEEVAAPLHAF